MTGDSPPDDGHDRRTDNHERHQDGSPARMKTKNVIVSDLDRLEEADLGTSQKDEVRCEGPVGREEEVEGEEEGYDELDATTRHEE